MFRVPGFIDGLKYCSVNNLSLDQRLLRGYTSNWAWLILLIPPLVRITRYA